MSSVRDPRPRDFPLHLIKGKNTSSQRYGDDSQARLLLIHGGKAVLSHGETKEPLTSGQIVFIPPDMSCEFAAERGFDWTLIECNSATIGLHTWEISHTPEFLGIFKTLVFSNQQKDTVKVLALTLGYIDQARAIVEELASEIIKRAPGWRDLAINRFIHLIVLICRHVDNAARTSPNAIVRIACAMRYMESHFHEQITLKQLAKSCKMSERTFYRSFRLATANSPGIWLKQFRIERATEKLRTTNATITEIAYGSGFEDSNFFSREFRKLLHMSPSDYRNLWRAQT